MDLDAVADELYGLTPGEFTSARQARVAQARQSGDRELAAAIKGLRRPTTGAWLANLLVRDRHEDLLQLLELGEATRRAHSQLDADDLRRLSRQRRQVVSALSHDARRLAGDRGQVVSEPVGRELEETLEAAFADPDACEAVRSGRLTVALSYSGLGPVDVTDAVGGVAAGPRSAALPVSPVSPASSTKAASTAGRDEVDRQRRARSEAAAAEAVREAQAAVVRAEKGAQEQERRLADARDRLKVRRREVNDLEQQLQDLRDARAGAADDVAQAEEARSAAARRVSMAADQLGQARADLEERRS